MEYKRKISKWGGSVGISLPNELLQYLKWHKGINVIIEDKKPYIIIKKEE
jgi:antitoxin component of MazEF toxin-antitoxin module